MPAPAWILNLCVLVYAFLLWWPVRHEHRLPALWALLAAGGAVGAIQRALLGILFPESAGSWPPFAAAWVGAPVAAWRGGVEELSKAVVVLAIRARAGRWFEDALHGVVAGSLVGLGYALAGVGLAAFRDAILPDDPGRLVHLLGGCLAQGVYPALLGAALGWTPADRGKRARVLRALGGVLGAAAGHALYLGLAQAFRPGQEPSGMAVAGLLALEWGGAAVLVVVWVWGARRQRALLASYLWGEVALGTLTDDEFHAVIRDGSRLGGPLRSALVQLALAKRRLVRGEGREEEVQAWRDRVAALRRRR
ncbi:MAG: PrsW family glutamic-type intramembrane protease [Armatimonadota bacterium]|nr:PrsW family glutamic-type intramembrane protease [Armatimonadota bacterium]MDR7411034.1 PrsW family glutamic-type intramembrane protease [Armatimonadota bacterium]MDR7413337.1 PrsW family glutamic-type intramembrane protease [Armatimonadota bacterium]MDR7428969.1 PrsW family glutamic-type intramembrane protease [Armatimonadota bacterium]MDR7430965.1 PrsW family glutamic-type intramembrane protease [Armatimonadota bacterium]